MDSQGLWRTAFLDRACSKEIGDIKEFKEEENMCKSCEVELASASLTAVEGHSEESERQPEKKLAIRF